MRRVVLAFALFLLLVSVAAQWDDEPGWPNDPDDDDPQWPEDPEESRPPWATTTRRPTSTRWPTRPTSTTEPDPEETEEPEPPAPTPTGVDTFANATIYQPDDATHHLTSPRTVNLPNNTILAVWNDSAQINGTLAVYRSTNDGFSWYAHGTATSTIGGRKLLEPHILFLEGSWSGDTNMTLLAVNAVDEKSTNIELYASWDQGVTFEFVHRVAEGGPRGSKAVGQPFMLMHDKRLSIYYTDARDPQRAQKIVHQSTADMWESWGTAIDVVVAEASTGQIGIPSIARLPNNQYIIAFESVTDSASSVAFKLTGTPENASKEPSRQISTSTGAAPRGAPYITWSPVAGTNGTIVLSDSASNSVFVNQALGEGMWREVTTTAGRAYGREVRAVPKDVNKLRIVSGSEGFDKASDVLVTIMDLGKALAAAR